MDGSLQANAAICVEKVKVVLIQIEDAIKEINVYS